MKNVAAADQWDSSFVSDSEPIFTAAASPIISMGSGKAMSQTYSASSLLGK